jgi:hypothetical protein
MIPQVEIRWFLSQTIWLILFFGVTYYFNHITYSRLKQKRKSNSYLHSLQDIQLHGLHKEIKTLEAELWDLNKLEHQEKEMMKAVLMKESMNALELSLSEMIDYRKSMQLEIEESRLIWVNNLVIDKKYYESAQRLVKKALNS